MPPKIYPNDASKYPAGLSHREALDMADDFTSQARDLMESALAKSSKPFAEQDAEKARDATRKSRQTLNGLAMTGIIDEGETVSEFLQRSLTSFTIQNIHEQNSRVDRAAKILRFGGTIAEAKDNYASPIPSAEDWYNQYLKKLEPVEVIDTTVEPTAEPAATAPTAIAKKAEAAAEAATTEKKSSIFYWIAATAVAATAYLLTKKKRK